MFSTLNEEWFLCDVVAFLDDEFVIYTFSAVLHSLFKGWVHFLSCTKTHHLFSRIYKPTTIQTLNLQSLQRWKVFEQKGQNLGSVTSTLLLLDLQLMPLLCYCTTATAYMCPVVSTCISLFPSTFLLHSSQGLGFRILELRTQNWCYAVSRPSKKNPGGTRIITHLNIIALA